jgi:DtxR family Mn-dependent transcriptional regulator
MSQPCRLPDDNVAITVFEDEVLEFVWEREEEAGAVFFEEVFERLGHRERLESMERAGLFKLSTGGSVQLSDAGRARARDIIRRHRLAERLFMDVLDIKDYEDDACHIEHNLSREAEEAICTLLGHPPRCPHDKPIPPGNCCAVFTRKVKPLATSLKEMEVGSEGRVVFINVPAMDRLANMGLVPGAVIRLVQKRPSFVIEIEETSLALDEDIATGIFLKQIRQA